MNCASFKNSLFALSENDYSLFSADEFEAHSKECAECSILLEEFSKTMAIIEQDKLNEPDPFVATRLIQKLENYQKAEIWWVFPVSKPVLQPLFLGIGIVVAILLGVVMGFEESGLIRTRIANNFDIESVRSELNVPDVMGDDVVQFSNQ
jgi:hypothetical protein